MAVDPPLGAYSLPIPALDCGSGCGVLGGASRGLAAFVLLLPSGLFGRAYRELDCFSLIRRTDGGGPFDGNVGSDQSGQGPRCLLGRDALGAPRDDLPRSKDERMDM